MKLQRTTWVLLVGLLLTAAAPASARKWNSSSGKFTIEAELVEAKDGNVQLKRPDGKIITVPIDKLSNADRDHLAAITKSKEKAEATEPTPDAVIAAIKKLRWRINVDKNKAVVVVYCPRDTTDAELKHLKGLTSLQHLFLSETKVTDAGLEHLKGLTKLQSLFLTDTKVTGAGLVHLKGLTSLQELWLHRTKVTDTGLVHLKGLTSLESLILSSTKVTDAGLEHLKGVTKLRWLRLGDAKVTDEGVKKLQRALPNCNIHH